MIPVAFTIAGSDSGGCAGIQADLKTFSALGTFGTSAITCITAQNTLGVRAIHAVPTAMVVSQIEAVLDDFQVGAIKTGMLYSAEIILALSRVLAIRGADIPLVVDPVMIATSGDRLITEDAVHALVQGIFPRANLVTPNLDEAAALTGMPKAAEMPEMVAQGRAILALGARAVLMKGGHARGPEAVDTLVTADDVIHFAAPRLATFNTHGTGCTLSAAIAAGLAKGLDCAAAVDQAKLYLSKALASSASWTLGHGAGPVDHFVEFRPRILLSS